MIMEILSSHVRSKGMFRIQGNSSNLLKVVLIGTLTLYLIFPVHLFTALIPSALTLAMAEENMPVVIEFVPVKNIEAGKDVEISINAEPENTILNPKLYYRRTGEVNYSVIRMKRNIKGFSAIIPGKDITSKGLEYYIAAEDMNGNSVTEGAPEKPHFAVVMGELDEKPPRISFKPLSRAKKGKPVILKADITDESDIETVWLYYKKEGEVSFDMLPMKRSTILSDIFESSIPASEGYDKNLLYYIEATDKYKNIASRGSEDKPYMVKMIAVKKKSIFKKWWFWAIVAAVGGGVAAASGGAVSGGDTPPELDVIIRPGG